MPRSRARSAGCALLLVIGCALPASTALAPPVTAAVPDVEGFRRIAATLGLECEAVSSDFACHQPDDTGNRVLSMSVSDPGASFYLSATQVQYDVAGPMAADPDFMAGMEEMVTLALDDDAAGLAWLAEMNAGPQTSGQFVQDDWTFTWLVETFEVDPGLTAQLSFDMSHFDGGEEPSPPDTTEVDPCALLTEAEVESVTGMEAQPGVTKETGTVGQIGCGWGTAPYEVQVAVTPSTGGA
ncbi:MAG TPA: hypothetical protein VF367_02730, partial [Candidatus Limnocylindria bacterium]